jgi:ERCC4-type nuclease
MRCPMTIYVDTAEQNRESSAYQFKDISKPLFEFHVKRQKLPTADYAVRRSYVRPELTWQEIEDDPVLAGRCCVVERKTINDLVGSIIPGKDDPGRRDRFEREIDRISMLYGYGCVVVEGDLINLANGEYYSHAKPKSVIGTIIAWQQRYNVNFMYCHDRALAERMTYRILERWYRHA